MTSHESTFEESENGVSLDAIKLLSSSVTLPCGAVLPGRTVKCPMQETLAVPPLCIPPVEEFKKLYSRWARGRFGLILTGQVQVDINHLSTPTDVAIASDTLTDASKLNAWKSWASTAQAHGTPSIVQLAHPGKKGHRAYRAKGMPSQAPSAINVNVGPGRANDMMRKMAFGDASSMSEEEIDVFVEKWIYACRVVKEAGWAGVGIHGAHGFLLSEFLSPLANQRTDRYGGSPNGRMELMKRLVRETRAHCPPPMIVQVKVNSADFAQGGLDEDEALDQVRWLIQCGDVDIVEISGGNGEATSAKTSPLISSFAKMNVKGTYNNTHKAASTLERESYFTKFGQRIRDEIDNPHGVAIQLSGGFRTRLGMASSVANGACALVGLGRTAVLEPELPAQKLLNPAVSDADAVSNGWNFKGTWIMRWLPLPSAIKGSLGLSWYYMQQRRMGRGLEADPELDMALTIFNESIASWSAWFTSILGQGPVTIITFPVRVASTVLGIGQRKVKTS
ncbi:hypothetical protein CBS101457_002921 [Exobasidium rhododendri]|nr:hypothetical protein CBS101457_002921 [Exobasidium rhododendri]